MFFLLLFGWLIFVWGWEYVFIVMGVIGFVLMVLWIKLIYNLIDYLCMFVEELKFIFENGVVVDMDYKKLGSVVVSGFKLYYIK